eukprot:TRINITY_DN16205_c0_g1_i1.p1 TRINITY_DN16205_c0_g1~~TRINITY_DN16205_c0_g1_i1.p1  ORF type:complete len:189 (-),score=29.48 TRINITY_DN16205_c0_g1_i1:156-722(-)
MQCVQRNWNDQTCRLQVLLALTLSHCQGSGISACKELYELKIPRGIVDGNILRVPKMGSQSIAKRCGDLLVKVVVKKHSYFRNEGQDIHTDRKITISQAVLGDVIEVNTLYGKKKVPVHPGTEHGAVHKIPGYGLEHPTSLNKTKGNHYVHFELEVPTVLSEKQKKLMKALSMCEEPISPTSISESEL